MLALFASVVLAQTPVTLEPVALSNDLAILERALVQLHPGLTLHQSEVEYQANLNRLKTAWSRPRTLPEAYLELSEFLSTIRCGHTYANFYNQPESVASALFLRPDKLPLTFQWVEGRMLVTRGPGMEHGDEVTHVQGKPVREVLESLLRYVKADGSNDAKRVDDLQISGLGKHEAFDVFFPLVYPPTGGSYKVSVIRQGRAQKLELSAVSREGRRELLKLSEPEPWEHRVLDEGAGYLRLSSFTTWNFKFDWRARLREAFDTFRSRTPDHVIIDIRGNEGGDDDVIEALISYLLEGQITYQPTPQYLKFRSVPADLRPFLEAWDKSVFEAGEGETEARPNGYRRPGRSQWPVTIEPSPLAYRGKVWLLVGPSNSSATHYLASLFKTHKLATLVGGNTGGSGRGMNGSQFLKLNLPNSRFEVDIPLIATRPNPAGPDEGVVPDVLVERTYAGLAAGRDPELSEALALIKAP